MTVRQPFLTRWSALTAKLAPAQSGAAASPAPAVARDLTAACRVP